MLYIHSEGGFPISRFVELSESFKKEKPSYKNVKFLDNMILKKVYNLVSIVNKIYIIDQATYISKYAVKP